MLRSALSQSQYNTRANLYRCIINTDLMKNLWKRDQILNYQLQQRWIQIEEGLRVTYSHSEFTILQSKHQTQKEVLNKAQALFRGLACLAIYTSQEPGKFITKVKPKWFQFKVHDPMCFVNRSLSTFEDMLDYGSTYIFAIFRYASDDVIKRVLSQKNQYYVPHKNEKSSQILRYIQGEISEVKVDKKYQFNPEVRFLKKKRNLQSRQILAITKAGLCSTLIIKGGAGTGKSLTGCLIAIQFLLVGKNVIMAAVTDTGARSLAIHFVSQFALYHDQEKFLVIMERIKEIRAVQGFQLPKESKLEVLDLLDQQLKQLIKVNEETSQKIKFLFFNSLVTQEEYFSLHPSLRAYSFNTRVIINFLKLTNYSWSVLEVLETIRKIAEEILVNQKSKSLYLEAVQMTIHQANIVITNSSKAADLNRYQPEDMKFKPYLAIFDEAAQSTLIDAYCILSMDIKRLILIGDEKQLTAEVRGPHQQMKNSILKIMLQRERNIVVYYQQFRMHPEIAKLVSYLRYDGKLRNGFRHRSQIRELKGLFDNPVFMLDHNYPQDLPEGYHNYGYYNIGEIMMIKLYIDSFPPEMLQYVGIITIYRAQKELMCSVFQREIKMGLVVSTVDGYQGGEKDYLFASIVRSNDSGYVDTAESKGRLTVLLSRARKGLVIVGNAETLIQGCYDNPWKTVIYYLWISNLIYRFTPELDELAKEMYEANRKCGKEDQLQVEQVFEMATYKPDEMKSDNDSVSTKSIEDDFQYEIQDQPFIKRNYN